MFGNRHLPLMKLVQASTIISEILISSGVAGMNGGLNSMSLHCPMTNRISSPWNAPILLPKELRLSATRSNRYLHTGRSKTRVRSVARLCTRQSMCASRQMPADALKPDGNALDGVGYSRSISVRFAHGKFKLLLLLRSIPSSIEVHLYKRRTTNL